MERKHATDNNNNIQYL